MFLGKRGDVQLIWASLAKRDGGFIRGALFAPSPLRVFIEDLRADIPY
jgi:hypothetical protein